MDSVIKHLDTIPEDKKVRVQRTQSSFDPFEKPTNQVKRVHSENNACINFKGSSAGKESPKVRRHSSPSSGKFMELRVVQDGRSFIPASTPKPPGGALLAAWRSPEDQQGIMDNGVFMHRPAECHGGHERELQGGPKSSSCPMTQKFVIGRATGFRVEKKVLFTLTRKK
ncbi:CDK14 kinase, partial [Polypterus senegalus]